MHLFPIFQYLFGGATPNLACPDAADANDDGEGNIADAIATGDMSLLLRYRQQLDDEYAAYHDDEWGRPTGDDRRLFEKLCLEGFQSGLDFSLDRSDFLAPSVSTDWKTNVTPRLGVAGAFRNSAGRSAFRVNYARVAQPPDFQFFIDNTIGDSLLEVHWQDPEFDASLSAFYYVRVIEIPTPRWTTYDAVSLGIPAPQPTSLQERAVTSAIWYRP